MSLSQAKTWFDIRQKKKLKKQALKAEKEAIQPSNLSQSTEYVPDEDNPLLGDSETKKEIHIKNVFFYFVVVRMGGLMWSSISFQKTGLHSRATFIMRRNPGATVVYETVTLNTKWTDPFSIYVTPEGHVIYSKDGCIIKEHSIVKCLQLK